MVPKLSPNEVTWITRLCALAALAACAGGGGRPSGGEAADTLALADTLKAAIARAYDFSRPGGGGGGGAERMMALYPSSGRVVSASGGQLIASRDSLQAGIADFWRNVGQNMREPRWEWGRVFVERLAPDAAVLTGTWAIPHIAPTGRPHVIRGAWTAVFRRVNGEWKIVMEHLSVPPE